MNFRKIIIHIIVFICVFVFIDFLYSIYCYCQMIEELKIGYKEMSKEEIKFFEKNIRPKFRYFNNISRFKLSNQYINDDETIEGKNKQKGSIVLFGCSFAYGAFLDKEDKFSYKLSQITGRTVYNQAFSAMGLGQMLLQTESKELYDLIKTKPDYAIYVYIPDHLFRSCHYKYGTSLEFADNYYLSYVLKNGRLEKDDPLINQFNRFQIFQNISKNILCSPRFYAKDENENFDFVKAHFVQARENLQKHYPNLKFVIIKYPFNENNDTITQKDSQEYANFNCYNSKRWKELEDMGFIILDVKKLTGIDVNDSKYQLPDQPPNGKAWDTITPKVVETLHI